METFLQDVRYAVRTLRKSPAFTAIAVLCLTLGIATNTTLFSTFNAILLKPFPFKDPDRVVFLQERSPKGNGRASISYLNYLDWQAQTRTLSAIGAAGGRSLAITEGEEPERLNGQVVSASLFPMLGITPQLGRLFRPDEDAAGAPGVVLLGDEVWRRRYAADSSIIGRVISINNNPHTVVGVMPPRFKFPQEGELWVPMAPLLFTDRRDWRAVDVYGRLAPGATIEQADREIAAITERIQGQYALDTENRWVGNVIDLRREFIPDDVALIVTTMFGAVTFVLLIACANVANLMLTRATARQREIAVRAALGAGRGRIVRQLLTESVIVALAAGVLAVPLTWWGLRLIDMGIPAEDALPYYIHWSVDVPTVLYTAGISILTGLVFGLAPALQSSKGRLYDALKEGGRGSGAGASKNRVRSGLVVVELALALVLLVGASLFVRNFMAMQHAELGYDTSSTMTMRFYLPGTRYDSADVRRQKVEDILARVQALPGVEAATISNLIPLGGGGSGGNAIAEGKEVERGQEPFVLWTAFSGDWFRTFGVRLVSGRPFTAAEQSDSLPVAIVSRAFAQKLWPGEDAIGKRFRFTFDSARTWYSVVGIEPDMRTGQLDDGNNVPPAVYLPYRYLVARNNGLMVRVHGRNPASITSAVRTAIRGADPGIPVFQVMTHEKVRALSFWQYGLFGIMFAVFGGIALLLAAIGVYGVISYGVSQRTQEIGVRVALGAQRAHVMKMVVRQGMLLAAIGIGVGLVGALGVTWVVRSLLVGVSPTDPLSFGGVALFLTVIALLASYLPARRATSVDPIIALKFE
jgi:putative ABC transport system permease protein